VYTRSSVDLLVVVVVVGRVVVGVAVNVTVAIMIQ